MKYGSVCSGIEAATMAWHPLGWRPAFFSEIDKFPSAVLAHRYPTVPNLGDMTRYEEWPDDAIDLLVGGTPCQSFSIAGLRKGLADARGNLMLTYLAIAARYRPTWLVWENVPGALSVDEGRAFASLIGGMAELGYHASWRVLDAQYIVVDGYSRAVPQRRNRVFVVGHLGDWRRAAAVFLEPESLSGNPPPRREAGKGSTHDVAPSLVSSGRGVERGGDTRGQDPVVALAFGGNNCSGPIEVSSSLGAHSGPSGRMDFASETFVSVATREVAATITRGAESAGKGGYAGRRQEDDVNLVAIPHVEFDVAGTMMAYAKSGGDSNRVDNAAAGYMLPMAFAQNQRDEVRTMDVAGALAAEPGMKQQTYVAQQWAVRRLTPRECERLQGFPDDFTNIPWRGKPEAPDGPRYKALGNSMAVNAMRFIGQRIQMVEDIAPSQLRSAA